MASSMRCSSFLCASLLLWMAISASSLGHDLSMQSILKGILEDPKAGKHALLKLKDVEDGKAFLIGDGEGSYDYSDGPLGPANWGNLTSEWKICGDGELQSPIAIDENQVHLGNTSGMATYYNWAISELNVDNRIKIVFKVGGGSLYWNKYGPYKVIEVHWHTPSEHTINGERFPLESHTVHQGPNGEILVVGRLYTLGTEDSFLASIMEWETSGATFDIIELDNAKTDYYNYMGSLTTPPCTEGVTWIVRAEILNASTNQVEFFLNMNKGDNARPLQAINDRSIYFYQVNNIMMMK